MLCLIHDNKFMNNLYNMQNTQMQNMMAMMSNLLNNQQMNKVIIDPSKMDSKMRSSLIRYTTTYATVGFYRGFPRFKSQRSPFYQNFVPGPPNNICEVEVIYEHVLDVAELYAEKGIIDYSTNNKMNPVVLNSVGKEFTGTNLEANEHIRDHMVSIRTTFCNSVGTGCVAYPIKDDECVYTKAVTVIRDKNTLHFLPYNQTYRTAMITAAPIQVEYLLSDNRMTANDLAKTCAVIECVFQTAISTKHPVLILAPFGHAEENNPVEDIISVYNYCIYKYGHLFKKIIIGIPSYYPKSIFKIYNDGIIRPTEIVAEIDQKYEQLELKKNLMERSTQNIVENDDEQIENTPPNKEIKKKTDNVNNQNEFTPEQMQKIMKMMSTMMCQQKN